ncbi:MAG: UDP-N-acetylmuramate:L-alanyl-gamma-D-glutamyl-meso-diaminopimelate ligase, partial [Betaproteobacteria bacterium]|nr:UDP-N-acetylmuramate:L-alanyl-gamma-D-glutamyl-meso-diaminopimelate ligase [Betaproteobacteria bacterium]
VSARLGTGRAFVVEADEYDTAFFDKRSKFVHYGPRTAVLNNLEYDHADIFDDLGAIERQFHHLVRTLPAQARIVSNAGAAALERVLAQGCWSTLQRFGPAGAAGADWQAEGEPHDFVVRLHGAVQGRVRWGLAGVHNQLNALAAVAAAEHLGVPPAQSCEALAQFKNVRRRLELRGVAHGVSVYDDFAHHPTAIATTVDGLRRRVGAARILAVFEPRSNTMKLGALAAQLPGALQGADAVFCYSNAVGWSPQQVLAPLGARAQVHDDLDALVRAVVAQAQPGDQVLVMSNGSFGGVHDKLLAALEARDGHLQAETST